MKRKKRLTKRQRAQASYDDQLATSMEAALQQRFVPIDLETGSLRSYTPNLQNLPRGSFTLAQVRAKFEQFAQGYPELMDYFRNAAGLPDCFGVPYHHVIHNESEFINVNYEELERRLVAQMRDELPVTFDQELFKKLLPIDEEALRSLGQEAVVDHRALVGGAPCGRRNSCSHGAGASRSSSHNNGPSRPEQFRALGGRRARTQDRTAR